MRFVIHYKFVQSPFLYFFLDGVKLIPIAAPTEDRKTFLSAFQGVSQALKDGDLVCIFPEGQVTYDGQLAPYRSGIEKILEKDPVPVVPMLIHGMWGSFFSRAYGKVASKYSVILKRLRPPVELQIFPAWTPPDATAAALEKHAREAGKSFPTEPVNS